jgi:hypothetical protein
MTETDVGPLIAGTIRVAYLAELPAERADVPQIKGSDLPAAGEQS